MPNWFEPFPGLDARFPEPGVDARFPAPGTDTRFATPGLDAYFPAPGEDGRFGGAAVPPGTTSAAMSSPDAWPSEGSTVTITKGTSGGTPIGGVLTLDGADVTGDATDTGPTLVYVVPAGGSVDRTLTWTPDTGAAVIMTVYQPQSARSGVWLDPSTAHTEIGGTVTAISFGGPDGIVVSTLTATNGGGGGPTWTPEGFRSSLRGYLRSSNNIIPTVQHSRVRYLLDITIHAFPSGGTSNAVYISSGGGGTLSINTSNGKFVIANSGGVNQSYAFSGGTEAVDALIGRRIQIAAEFDYSTGTTSATMIGTDGYSTGLFAGSAMALAVLNQLRIGNNLDATFHKMAIQRCVSGQSFPHSLEREWQQFANVRLPEIPAEQVGIISLGQSLPTGSNWDNYAQRMEATYGVASDRHRAKMLAGLQQGDGTPYDAIFKPTTLGLNATAATGYQPLSTPTNYSPAMAMAALNIRHRERVGLPLRRTLAMVPGIPGQPIKEFSNSLAVATGSFGITIWNTFVKFVAEAYALNPAIVMDAIRITHGTGDQAMPEGEYRTAGNVIWNLYVDHIEAVTGYRPILALTQSAGRVNTDSNVQPWGVCLDQVQIVRDNPGAILATPLYPFKIKAGDDVHPNAFMGAMFGEMFEIALAEVAAGNPWNLLSQEPVVEGNTVTIPFSLRPGRVLIRDPDNRFVAYGGVVNDGFEATGAAITNVAISGNGQAIVVTCDAVPTMLQWGMQRADMTAFGQADGNFAAHRVTICTDESWQSLLGLGVYTHRHFIHSGRVSLT